MKKILFLLLTLCISCTKHIHAAANGNLFTAISSNDVAKVKELITNGADIKAKNQFGSTPLHLAAQYLNKEIIEILINKGADVNAQGNSKRTPLHVAVEKKDLDLVNFLIEKEAHVNTKDINGNTPLHWAARYSNKKIIETLIENGAQVDAQNNFKQTRLLLIHP